MRISTKASVTTALALLMAVAVSTFLTSGQKPPAEPAAAVQAMAPPTARGGMPCLYHVMIIHDVHWAAACMKNEPDDSPDCTLPPERAAVLNKAQQEAENFCERRSI